MQTRQNFKPSFVSSSVAEMKDALQVIARVHLSKVHVPEKDFGCIMSVAIITFFKFCCIAF